MVPCVAVIDEWNSRNYASEWASFRNQYPQRPFCLLVPNSGIQTLYVHITGRIPPSRSSSDEKIEFLNFLTVFFRISPIYSPTGFSADMVNNPDGIDRTSKYLRLQQGDVLICAERRVFSCLLSI